MLALILATLLIQDAPVFGITLSDDPELPVAQGVERPKPNLPAHALSDPFGYERAQCSPYIRKDEPLDHCQVRVRNDLLAVMGDDLPSALRPSRALENCTPGTAENNYQVECKPRQMTLPNQPVVQDRHCMNRPERMANGTIAVSTQCTPIGPEPQKEERQIVIFGND